MTKPGAIDIPSAAPSDAEPKPEAGPITLSPTLHYLHIEKFARYSLLVIVVFIGAVFLNMVKVFFVPVILAAVFIGLLAYRSAADLEGSRL